MSVISNIISRCINFVCSSTAFDSESLDFLVEDLGLNTLKISSGDITNGPFLLEHASKNIDLIISTGMATLDEVEEALGVVAFGLINGYNKIPSNITPLNLRQRSQYSRYSHGPKIVDFNIC